MSRFAVGVAGLGVSENLVHALLTADQTTEKGIAEQRSRVASLREACGRVFGNRGAEPHSLHRFRIHK